MQGELGREACAFCRVRPRVGPTKPSPVPCIHPPAQGAQTITRTRIACSHAHAHTHSSTHLTHTHTSTSRYSGTPGGHTEGAARARSARCQAFLFRCAPSCVAGPVRAAGRERLVRQGRRLVRRAVQVSQVVQAAVDGAAAATLSRVAAEGRALQCGHGGGAGRGGAGRTGGWGKGMGAWAPEALFILCLPKGINPLPRPHAWRIECISLQGLRRRPPPPSPAPQTKQQHSHAQPLPPVPSPPPATNPSSHPLVPPPPSTPFPPCSSPTPSPIHPHP